MTSTWPVFVCGAFVIGCGDNEHPGTDAPPTPDAAPDAPAAAPGIVMLDYTFAVDVTTDGRTALFENLTGVATVVLYDTVTNIGRDVTTLTDPSVDLATGLSDTLAISAEYGNPVESGVWSETTDWVTFPPTYAQGCDVFHGGTFDINRDGTVTTGILWHGCATEAFRASGGTVTALQVLGTPTGGALKSNRGTVVSDDGKVIGGFAANGTADRTPAKWDAAGTGVLLDPTNTENPGEVLSISADGSVLAGVLLDEGFGVDQRDRHDDAAAPRRRGSRRVDVPECDDRRRQRDRRQRRRRLQPDVPDRRRVVARRDPQARRHRRGAGHHGPRRARAAKRARHRRDGHGADWHGGQRHHVQDLRAAAAGRRALTRRASCFARSRA